MLSDRSFRIGCSREKIEGDPIVLRVSEMARIVMKNDLLQRYQKTLRMMQHRSRDEISRMIQVVLDNDMAVGEHDRCVSESIDKELALEHTEEVMQGMVHDALVRIDEGTYGKCEQCRHVIPRVRLNAIPFTPYCVQCERDREK